MHSRCASFPGLIPPPVPQGGRNIHGQRPARSETGQGLHELVPQRVQPRTPHPAVAVQLVQAVHGQAAQAECQVDAGEQHHGQSDPARKGQAGQHGEQAAQTPQQPKAVDTSCAGAPARLGAPWTWPAGKLCRPLRGATIHNGRPGFCGLGGFRFDRPRKLKFQYIQG